ncbi:MAG: S-methyl-5-thioribose-1-phosphate isomerase [Candidatus Omnitrophica bacterium]|nr:S-methyl-5-thioribose-1-phosphate isomerase [Candidatus Omnitrophota bacterium]
MKQETLTRALWLTEDTEPVVRMIDQRFLPHRLVTRDLKTFQEAVEAVTTMAVRGAPLIGVTAAFGMWLAVLESAQAEDFEEKIGQAALQMKQSRPTAVNLAWAVDRMLAVLKQTEDREKKQQAAFETARAVMEEEIECCRKIGEYGLALIEEIARRKQGKTVNILTHCNAGWLACVAWGTATSPIYQAFQKGIEIHVWVDETRPRNQGAGLTAWELLQAKVPHTVIVDNAGGHLMQHGQVDMVITGTDRTTACGDAANKIGTYLKALAARDNQIPFYIAAPSSSIDWSLSDGVDEIPIEERSADEVIYVEGDYRGERLAVRVTPEGSPVSNYGFDVTPARLITGLITERGICPATREGLLRLFPERK